MITLFNISFQTHINLKNNHETKSFTKIQKQFLKKHIYHELYPSGSAPSCIYDIPKMHTFFSI